METVNQDVLDLSGKKVGSVQLDGGLFAARIYPDLLHQVVRWQRAKRRSGTHNALTRSNMKGGKKKPFKQKGTGNARAGSSVSPLWVGGASIHGPTPRSYEFSLQRKVKQKALSSALTDKCASGSMFVFDDLNVASGKTRDMSEILKNIGCSDKKVLVIVSDNTQESNLKTLRACRNLTGVSAVPVMGLNVYDLINSEKLIVSKNALESLSQRMTKKAKA